MKKEEFTFSEYQVIRVLKTMRWLTNWLRRISLGKQNVIMNQAVTFREVKQMQEVILPRQAIGLWERAKGCRSAKTMSKT